MATAPDVTVRGCRSMMKTKSEAVIQTSAHHVAAEVHIGRQRARSRRATDVAEIDIEIFDLGGPIGDDRGFDAAAGGPTDLGVACSGKAHLIGMDAADGEAAGDVRHPAIERVAEAAARGPQPIVFGFATCRAGRTDEAAFDAAPANVTFQTEHGRAAESLPVVADGAADEAAGRTGIGAVGGLIRAAPSIAAVDTDIEAGPVVDRYHHSRRSGRHGTRQIRRNRIDGSQNENANCGEEYATHTHLPCLCSQLRPQLRQNPDGSWN